MKVSIDKKIIDESNELISAGHVISTNCPLALKIKRMLKKRVTVDGYRVAVYSNHKWIDRFELSDSARKFLRAFDSGFVKGGTFAIYPINKTPKK